jgi:hypothetical protein
MQSLLVLAVAVERMVVTAEAVVSCVSLPAKALLPEIPSQLPWAVEVVVQFGLVLRQL